MSCHTGRITNRVMARAMPIITLFGGLCCRPMAWRRMARTMMKRVKQVISISIAGSRPSRVISTRICSLTLRVWPSSVSLKLNRVISPPAAWAAMGSRAVPARARTASRRAGIMTSDRPDRCR
ncbi:hypothetical protein D3C77_592370 [compost metagenome]